MPLPPEVAEYFHQGDKKIVSVQTLPPYQLIVTFEDGQSRKKNMEDQLTGVFSVLSDYSLFSKAYAPGGRCIAWDTSEFGRIDIDKDAIYIYGEPVDIRSMQVA